MTSTTLMTFLLRTGPHVRSVKLLGSWDNFSKPYAMERDKRVGAGQWRGCHTFTNIVCDGLPNSMLPARTGGLKMGGTYWYYYLLDDDVEYYNDAEPVTTHCPFLPGQPVNVLQVPIFLPDTKPTHTRSRSPRSQRTEQTMNPEDKYMNPREPPKPKLRLRTSPPLLQAPTPNWSFSTSPLGAIANRSSSQPAHGAPKNKCHRIEDKAARSVSPPRSRGLRAAFRQWGAPSPNLSPTAEQDNNIALPVPDDSKSVRTQYDDRLHLRSHSNDSYMRSPSVGIMPENHRDGPLLRRPVSAGAHDSTSLSIQERRALNSKASGHSAPKNPLTLRAKPTWTVNSNGDAQATLPLFIRRPLSTPSTPSMLRRPSDRPSTPEGAATPTPHTVMNKRLPTLPNSPSSVMDEALRDLDARERELDMEALGSHFSDFTETDSVDGAAACERSRFSEWSTDTELISPESMTSSSTFNEKQESPAIPAVETPQLSNASNEYGPSDPNTPHLTVGSKSSPATLQEDSPRFDLHVPRLTITLSPSDLSIPGLHINEEGEELLESNPKRHAAFFEAMELKGLGLTSPPASTLCFPEGFENVTSAEKTTTPTNDPNRYSTGMLLSQSATMKEMMDELSYLKNMIQSGTVPDL
ncbi:uncharacterized protein BJX67DRAFT_90577 [Aspergillus lucknowensis]|uniref:Uncharacterized protein n=1 Tax=Aspergillus lucknowensis TaxID=176173 RepID=A0ABR4M5K3_9EURO